MDSETAMGAIGDGLPPGTFPRIGDYSEPAILQFREQMKANFKDRGGFPAYASQFGACQTPENPTSWDEVFPPRDTSTLDVTKSIGDPSNTPCWNNWQGFRVKMVNQMVGDSAKWVINAGMPAHRVWNHQSVNNDSHFFWYEASPVQTAAAGPGMPGFDLYEPQLYKPDGNGGMIRDISVMIEARDEFGGRLWALAEFSAGLGSNANLGRAIVKEQVGDTVTVSNGKCLAGMEQDIKERTYETLMSAYENNNRIAMPFLWNPIPWDSTILPEQQSALLSWGISDCKPAMDAYRQFVLDIDALQ
jgi:hypothetical protein